MAFQKQTRALFKRVFLVLMLVMLSACSSNQVAYVARTGMRGYAVYPKNFSQYADKVVLIKNLSYPSKYPNNTYDLYLPKLSSSTQKVPVLIWVHGGAFVGGDKSHFIATSTMIASAGYVVISMNYQVAPEKKYPTPLDQLQEMHAHLATLKKMNPMMDTNKLFLGGDSAGAQIVAQFAALQTNAKLSELMQRQPVVSIDSLLGVLLYCGPFDPSRITSTKSAIINSLLKQIGNSYMGEGWQTSPVVYQANVIAHVNDNYPPTYVTDGNYFSFPDHGKALVAALEEKNTEVQYRFYDKHPRKVFHEFQVNFSKPEAWEVFNDTVEFLNKHSQ